MNSVSIKAPAKLNLFLKVINKRPDNYHNIETLFERINLTDSLQFTKIRQNKIVISIQGHKLPVGPKNLVYKAVMMLKQDFNINSGVKIRIRKAIPVAAGLGGGSSDAAAALMAGNKLFGLKLKKAKLLKYAARLGSDVPFFIHKSSWAKGVERGDNIKPLNIRIKLYHILVVPKVSVYSKLIYGSFKMQLTKRASNASILIHNLKKNNISYINRYLINDLETAILRQFPGLTRLKKRLNLLGVKAVLVSGSGPAVFGITGNEVQARTIKKILARKYSQVFVVHTL